MPELFQLIVEKIHLLPFWTGIMIKQGIAVLDFKQALSLESLLRYISRFDNNNVENWFEYIKHKIQMGIEKGLVPSEIVPKIYNKIKVIIIFPLYYWELIY